MQNKVEWGTRSCWHLSQADQDRCAHHEREIALVELIVTRGDAPEVFDAIEKAFNEIASCVDMGIKVARVLTIRARWNHRLRTTGVDGVDQRPRIIGFGGDHLFNLQASQQGFGLGHIMGVSRTQETPNRIPERIDQGMKLGGQPTTGAADRLAPVFWGAPAACWWTRITVLSMKTSSKSDSFANSWNT